MNIATSRTVLHAASHGHISVLRQRALMYDVWEALHVVYSRTRGGGGRCGAMVCDLWMLNRFLRCKIMLKCERFSRIFTWFYFQHQPIKNALNNHDRALQSEDIDI